MESHIRGNLGEELDKTPVLGRAEKKGWAPYNTPHATASSLAHQLSESCASQCIHPPRTPGTLDLRLPAILEGWLHHLWEANHCRSFPCLGLPALWRRYNPTEQHPAPPAPWKRPTAQKSWYKLGLAIQNLPPLWGDPANPGCPGEEPLGFSEAWLSCSRHWGCCTPVEQLPSTASPLQEPGQPRKSRTSLARRHKICLH